MVSSKGFSEREAFWRSLINEHSQSGDSIRHFCEQRGVSQPSFFAWRKRIRDRDKKSDMSATEGQLVPVVLDSQNNEPKADFGSCPHFEILTPNGFVLRFAEGTASETILPLLAMVARYDLKEATLC